MAITGATSPCYSTDEGEKEKEHDGCQLNNDEIRILVESMEEKLEEVYSLQSDYDIYQVPRPLHMVKPEAYRPQVVSIGPLHHNEEHLLPIGTHKLRYLNQVLNRPGGKTLDVYVKAMSDLEEKARNCYSEIIGCRKDELVRMMVLDGCFIIEFIRIIDSKERDHLLSNVSWYFQILKDLIKLENQLPFFVLECLYGLVFDGRLPPYITFSHYVYMGLLRFIMDGFHDQTLYPGKQLKVLPLPKEGTKHFLDLLRCALIPSSPRKMKYDEKHFLLKHCASELRSVGVKFQRKKTDSSKTYLLDIDFDMRKGVLTIPTLHIGDEMELFIRNLMAFEQGQHVTVGYFIAYAFFMDGLIDTVDDVDLLEKKGIIVNNLGSAGDVTTLFNNITKEVMLVNPYFSDIIKELEDYYDKEWNKLKANLKQNYFKTPWALISFGAALFLLILTIIQTICSILQVIPHE